MSARDLHKQLNAHGGSRAHSRRAYLDNDEYWASARSVRLFKSGPGGWVDFLAPQKIALLSSNTVSCKVLQLQLTKGRDRNRNIYLRPKVVSSQTCHSGIPKIDRCKHLELRVKT